MSNVISSHALKNGQDRINKKYSPIEIIQNNKRDVIMYVIQDAARAIASLPDGRNVRKYICQISNAEAELRELEKNIYKMQAKKSQELSNLWK